MSLAFLADGPVAGVALAVEKDGEVILAKGYGLAEIEHNVPVTVETVFRLGSISKQFAAVAILQLVEQGKIGLHDPITRFLPDYPTQGNEVTIHHLLTHTSGIASYTDMGAAFWDKSRLDLTHEEMVELFGGQAFDFAPGEQWKYNNSGYYLLGMIVEVAAAPPVISMDHDSERTERLGPQPDLGTTVGPFTGAPVLAASREAQAVDPVPFAEYLETHIFGPLGMTGSSYCDETEIVPHRAEGYEREGGQLVNDQPLSMNLPGAAGALCSTVLDLLRWQRALDSNALISAASRERMLTEATLNDGSSTGYAYGLSLGELSGHRTVSHGGGINGFNTMLATYPDDGLVVTVLTNTNGAGPGALEAQIARLALGLPLEVTMDLPTDGLDLGALAGTYRFEQAGISADMEVREDQLWMVADGLGEVRLKYQGELVFELLPGQRIRFVPDGDPPSAFLMGGGAEIEGVKEGR
ncbi:MAG: serine hydrolase domain-containing protein [Longimicrobiales bacterium]